MHVEGIFEWIHVVSAFLFLGYALLSTIGLTLALRTDDASQAATAVRVTRLGDWTIGFSSYVLLLVTGFLLVWERELSFGESWLMSGLVLYAVSLAMWMPPLLSLGRQDKALYSDLNSGKITPRDINKTRSKYALLIAVPFLFVIAAFYIMIEKPELW